MSRRLTLMNADSEIAKIVDDSFPLDFGLLEIDQQTESPA